MAAVCEPTSPCLSLGWTILCGRVSLRHDSWSPFVYTPASPQPYDSACLLRNSHLSPTVALLPCLLLPSLRVSLPLRLPGTLQLCPGRPYNEYQAQQAVASVYSLDLFDSVDLHLRPDEQWGHAGAVAVDVVVRERQLAGVQADMDWMVVPGRGGGGGGGGGGTGVAAGWGLPRLVSAGSIGPHCTALLAYVCMYVCKLLYCMVCWRAMGIKGSVRCTPTEWWCWSTEEQGELEEGMGAMHAMHLLGYGWDGQQLGDGSSYVHCSALYASAMPLRCRIYAYAMPLIRLCDDLQCLCHAIAWPCTPANPPLIPPLPPFQCTHTPSQDSLFPSLNLHVEKRGITGLNRSLFADISTQNLMYPFVSAGVHWRFGPPAFLHVSTRPSVFHGTI